MLLFSLMDAKGLIEQVQGQLSHQVSDGRVKIFGEGRDSPLACLSVIRSLGGTSILVELFFEDSADFSSRFTSLDLAFDGSDDVELLLSEENLCRAKKEVALLWVQHLMTRV